MRLPERPHLHHGPPESGTPDREKSIVALEKSLQHIRIDDPQTLERGNFPDFLILGPQRTGTTWLFHNLKKHPQIFLPPKKETYFFSTLGRPGHPHHQFDTLDDFLAESMTDRSRRWLKRQYDCLRKYHEVYRPAMRGEATATNALLPVEVIREITVIRPALKAILMLRDPVERAWSHARKDLMRNTGRKFEEVPREELERFFRTTGQRALASYSSQIRRWSSCLAPGNFFIGEFEMIASAPEKLVTGIHRFLGIRSGRKYFNRHLRERINSSDGQAIRQRPVIPPGIREHLASLLESELREYHRIRSTLDPSRIHRAIHDRHFQPGAPRTQPKSKHFDPAA